MAKPAAWVNAPEYDSNPKDVMPYAKELAGVNNRMAAICSLMRNINVPALAARINTLDDRIKTRDEAHDGWLRPQIINLTDAVKSTAILDNKRMKVIEATQRAIVEELREIKQQLRASREIEVTHEADDTAIVEFLQ